MTSASRPEFHDYVALTNRELVRLGVPIGNVTRERESRTGHVRALSKVWARSVGSWGGILTLREVADRLEVPIERAHSWMMFWGLKTKTRTRSRTPAQLALLSLGTRGSAREVGRRLGVLPCEVALYRASAQLLQEDLSMTFRELLSLTPHQLETAWASLGLAIGPPSWNARAPGALEGVWRDAKRSPSEPTELDRLVRAVKRELPNVESGFDLSAELDDIIRLAEAELGA